MYASIDDITDAYSSDFLKKISSDDRQTIDAVSVNTALLSSTALINSYLTTAQASNTDIVEILRRYCVDISVYFIAQRQGVRTEEMRTRYDDAILWLDVVGSGKHDREINAIGSSSSTFYTIPFYHD